MVVFFDDILICSPSYSSHLEHLEVALSALSRGKFSLCRTKCLFAVQKLNYLAHIVSPQGISSDPVKIQVMLDWPSPSSPS